VLTSLQSLTRFAALRQICSVRRSLSRSTLLTLVQTLVVTKVDYCSSVLSDISGQLLQRLQSVFNAAARLVFSARKLEHITPLLCELHWLKVPERIQCRFCVLTYCCLKGTVPSYLAETINLTANVGSSRRLRSASPSTRHATLVPGGCCLSVECFSAICSFCAITAAVLPRPEDTVPVIVLFTIVSSSVTDCNFNIVRCPCNGPVREVSDMGACHRIVQVCMPRAHRGRHSRNVNNSLHIRLAIVGAAGRHDSSSSRDCEIYC